MLLDIGFELLDIKLFASLLLLPYMTQSVDVLVKSVAVDGTSTHRRLVVVDGLGGIE